MNAHQHDFSRAAAIRLVGPGTEEALLEKTCTGVFWLDLELSRPSLARAKRLLDVVLSTALIILLAPLLALVFLLIKLTSRGPAIYVQRRIGFRCQEVGMYKFRTMVKDADRLEAALQQKNGRAFLKIADDPRVTTIGRFLRKFSLDELPQLFNVLDGTMSLVGPRPLLLSDLGNFPKKHQMRRFSMKPGITGLWQVSGRSSTSDGQRLQLDRDYVNRWSLWLDLKILARTIRVVLTGDGAV